MNSPRPANGYTLIELLVVLLVVALIVSSAAPSLQGYVERNRTERALDVVASDVALARLVAVREGRSSVVSFTSEGYSIQVSRADGTQGTVKTVNLAGEYPGVGVDADGDISFSSRGLLLGGGDQAFVRVENTHHRDSIFVSPAGRIYRGY